MPMRSDNTATASLDRAAVKAKPARAPKKTPAEAKVQEGSPQRSTNAGNVVGDAVSHPQFGEGIVTEINLDKLTINFADGRVKQIVDYYVKRLPAPQRTQAG